MQAKMKELSMKMVVDQTSELSFALVIFASVIFIGIIGLGIVVVHRQKKKRQLKALLRAKNLGPLLESKEIATNTGKKYYPRYTTDISLSTAASPHPGTPIPNPDIETTSPPPETIVGVNKLKKLDINDLLAGIMVRMRKSGAAMGESSIEDSSSPEDAAGVGPGGGKNSKKDQLGKPVETSFYYKESSLSSKDENFDSGDGGVANVAVQIHHDHHDGEDSPDNNSYVSRISQQVFVSDSTSGLVSKTAAAKNYPKSAMKSKVATFFSSVSKYKSGSIKTKL